MSNLGDNTDIKDKNVENKGAGRMRVRFAPSPTGRLHVGGARTALFNWLFAKGNGGEFVLRIEDTDRERSKKEFEGDIIEGLQWLGLNWDGEVHRQSEKTEIYKKYLKQLLENGSAYYCYCTKDELEAERELLRSKGLPLKYGGRCRDLESPPENKKPEAIRFKTPEEKIVVKDIIRGDVLFDASLFGDMVIAKNMDTPLYNFAVVIDDALMEITHVIRGEDHLSNTPKQILIQRTLGFPELKYAHIPLLLNPDRSKMSKRFSDTALLSYRDNGYLPEAMVNFLALLGWHPKDDKEFLTPDELIKEFDLSRVQSSGAVWNEEKLNWLNREYLKSMETLKIAQEVKNLAAKAATTDLELKKISASLASMDAGRLSRIIEAERGRSNTLIDFLKNGAFFFKLPEYDSGLLVWRDSNKEEAEKTILSLIDIVGGLADIFDRNELESVIAKIIGEKGRGEVLWPFRVALSGSKASPDPIDIACALGKEETLRRLKVASEKLK